MSTVYALGITLVVLLALWGWGLAAVRVLRAPERAFGIVAVAGLGVFLGFAGLLEMLGVASEAILLGFAAVGLALAGVMGRGAARPAERLRHVGALAVLGLVFAVFAVNIAGWHFISVDDLHGYLVMPERVLQTGSTGRDPFLFRRYEGGLGGSNYLYALFLAFTDYTHLRLADLGLGSVLLAALVAGHARQTASGAAMLPAALALALVIVLCSPVANLTPDICAIAGLYALLRVALTAVREARIPVGSHLLLGLLAFTLVCLRSTYLVPAVALLAAFYLALLASRRSVAALLPGVAAAGLAAALALPWLVAADRVAETPLYPFLGFGLLTHDEVRAFAAPRALLQALVRMVTCFGLALWAWHVGLRHLRMRAAPDKLFLTLALGLSILALGAAQLKYTVFGYRYGFVGFVTLPLFLVTECFHAAPSWRPRRGLALAGLALALVFVAPMVRKLPTGIEFGQLYVALTQRHFTEQGSAPALDVSDPATRARLSAQLGAMQQAVPPGERLLVRVDAPFLLDFRRNPVWVMDHPGQIGPPPGVPAEDTDAAWTAYLQAAGVRYVAYSYGDEAADSVALGTWFKTTLPGPSFWQDRIEERLAAVHAVLLGLRTHAHLVYDDGERFVADLKPHLAAGAPATRAPGT